MNYWDDLARFFKELITSPDFGPAQAILQPIAIAIVALVWAVWFVILIVRLISQIGGLYKATNEGGRSGYDLDMAKEKLGYTVVAIIGLLLLPTLVLVLVAFGKLGGG